MDISRIVPFINAICTVVSFILGFIISNYFHSKNEKKSEKKERFLEFYLPFIKNINYQYLVDSNIIFSELTETDKNFIMSLLTSKDYLATKEIQHSIYSINKLCYLSDTDKDKELLDKEWSFLLNSIINEYRSLASELGYATIL